MVNRLFGYLRRYRWFVLGFALLASVLFVVIRIELNRLADSLVAHTYKSYVALEFMPARKKETGRWPDSLDPLPGFIDAKLRTERAPATRKRLELVRAFHRDNYRQLRIVPADGEKCRFVIQLKNEQAIEGEADRNETL